MTGTIRQRQAGIGAMIEDMGTVTRNLAHASGELQALTAEARARIATIGGRSEATVAEVNKTVVRLGGLIGQAEQGVSTVNGALPGLLRKSSDTIELANQGLAPILQKTNETLDTLNAIARDARVVSAAAAEAAPAAIRSVTPIVEDTHEIVQGAKRSWPFSSFATPAPPAALPIDSHDSKVLDGPTSR